jgi:Zn-dependent M28 family amino/carboxypeptidase
VKRQEYRVSGSDRYNVEVEALVATRPEEIVIVGAHVGTVLALARRFSGRKTGRTLRFVAFATEEPPYFQTDEIGSRVYARRCRARGEDVVGMLSLEAIGYPYYHKPEDTIGQIDFEQVARLVRGFEDVIAVLTRESELGGQSCQ